MGYTTEFYGSLDITPTPTKEFKEYINIFNRCRHMSRNNDRIKELYPNWKTLCFHEKLGNSGEYFIGGREVNDTSVDDNNMSPTKCPGLWCQWIIDDDNCLAWDNGEKFYNYVEWLQYLIDNFFEPDGYKLNGKIEWRGEDYSDIGTIIVKDNKIQTREGIGEDLIYDNLENLYDIFKNLDKQSDIDLFYKTLEALGAKDIFDEYIKLHYKVTNK